MANNLTTPLLTDHLRQDTLSEALAGLASPSRSVGSGERRDDGGEVQIGDRVFAQSAYLAVEGEGLRPEKAPGTRCVAHSDWEPPDCRGVVSFLAPVSLPIVEARSREGTSRHGR